MSTPELNYIGIDLSGPQVRAALANSSGKIIQRLEAQVSPENLVEQLAVIVRDLGAASGVRLEFRKGFVDNDRHRCVVLV